jgi:hypothetical protein
MDATQIGGYVAVLMTIGVWSFLYKENAFYRFVEYTAVGTGIGVIVVEGLRSLYAGAIIPITTGAAVWYIIPIILGLLILARISPDLAHWSRLPAAVFLGASTGTYMRGMITASVLVSIVATFRLKLNTFDNIWYISTVLLVLMYFFYSRPATGVYGYINTIARYIILITFGQAWGLYMSYRVQLAVGRLIFVFRALGII